MKKIRIAFDDNSAVLLSAPHLTSGMVGLPAILMTSDYWDSFDQIIVTHRGSGEHLDTEIEDGQTIVPWECLKDAYSTLEIGIFGATEEGDRQTPTIWCKVGKIEEGAIPALEEGQEPSQTIVTRLEEEIAEKIGDAPADGAQYARQDGEWTEVTGGGGSSDYEDLENLPKIAGTTLIGDKSLSDLGVQAAITDLATIRTNATAGKTASDNLEGHTVAKNVPADAVFTDTIYDDTEITARVAAVETEVEGKQDTITDLATIRSGAAAGATAVQPEDIEAFEAAITLFGEDSFTCDKTPEQIYAAYTSGAQMHIKMNALTEVYIQQIISTAGSVQMMMNTLPDADSETVMFYYASSGGSTVAEYMTVETADTETVQSMINTATATKLNSSAVSHETWTFTLDDDSTVTKEVVTWNSQT